MDEKPREVKPQLSSQKTTGGSPESNNSAVLLGKIVLKDTIKSSGNMLIKKTKNLFLGKRPNSAMTYNEGKTVYIIESGVYSLIL